jgi:hypothetical protein
MRNSNNSKSDPLKEEQELEKFRRYVEKNKDAIMEFLNRDTNVLEHIKKYNEYRLKNSGDNLFALAGNASKQGAVEYAKELIKRSKPVDKAWITKEVINKLAMYGYNAAARELIAEQADQGEDYTPTLFAEKEKTALQGNETEKRHYCLLSPYELSYHEHVDMYVKKTTFFDRLFHSPPPPWDDIGSSGPTELLTYLRNKKCRKHLLMTFLHHFDEKNKLALLDFSDGALFFHLCEQASEHDIDLMKKILPLVDTQVICDRLPTVKQFLTVINVIQWFIDNKTDTELRQLNFPHQSSYSRNGPQNYNILTAVLHLTNNFVKRDKSISEALLQQREQIVVTLLDRGVDALCKYDKYNYWHALENSTCMYFVDDEYGSYHKNIKQILVKHIKEHQRGYDFISYDPDRKEDRTLLNYIDNAREITQLIEAGVRLPQNYDWNGIRDYDDNEYFSPNRQPFLQKLIQKANEKPDDKTNHETIKTLVTAYNRELDRYKSYVKNNKQLPAKSDTNTEISKALTTDEKTLMEEFALNKVLPFDVLIKKKNEIEEQRLPKLYRRLVIDKIDYYLEFHKTLIEHTAASNNKIPENIIYLISQYLSPEEVDNYMRAMREQTSVKHDDIKLLEDEDNDKKPPSLKT